MKKLMFLAVIAMVLTVFNSCQKDESILRDDEWSSVKYAQTKLNEIGHNILSVSDDPQLKSVIYEEIGKQFDGDNNVLLVNLDKALKLASTSLFKCLNKGLKSATTDPGHFEKLTDEDGNNYYPQIYIPFFEELKEKGIIGVKPPIFVVFVSGIDDSKEEYEGYILNNKGQTEKLEYPITEDIARSNEVWVISINERVDNEGQVVNNFVQSQNVKSAAISAINFKIEYMKVKSHKESWTAGKSEVAIRAYEFYWDGLDPITGSATQTLCDRSADDYVGIDIRKFSRDDVKYERNILLNYNLDTDWNVSDYLLNPIIYGYVIFESDAWPTGTRTENFSLADGTTRYMTFRSADASYSIGTIYGNTNNGAYQSYYAGSYQVNNGTIEFNTVLY